MEDTTDWTLASSHFWNIFEYATWPTKMLYDLRNLWNTLTYLINPAELSKEWNEIQIPTEREVKFLSHNISKLINLVKTQQHKTLIVLQQ